MINSVLNDLDIGSTQTETAAKVQAIVNAYQAILDSTDGVANNDSDNPTQTQYSTVGVNGVDTAQEESLLGDVLDTASRDGTNTDASAVDSVAKIQALATAVQAVMNANASKAQLDALGVTGVTDANLTSILAALDAATDTSELNTLANVQTVVTDAVNALSAISTAAQNNTANGTTVATAAQYDALGITGMGGTGQPTVAMINSVLNDLDIGSTQTETAAKVQAIVNAYQAILDSTDGVANNDSDNPTQTQYSTVGVNGVDTAQEESLLGDVLDTASRDGTNTDASAVDSVAKIQALATAVQAVMNANASKAQLDALGVTGVTDANLTSILAALDAATDTSELNTLANVQTVVTDAVNALSAISTAAQNNTANGTTVATAAQYDALGITGMGGTGQPTVAMINSVLNDLDIGSTQTETAAKVQAIVNAYQAILDSTDGVANNDSDNPTQTQYSTVGVNGVDTAQEESLLGDVLDTASRDGTNTDASAVDSVAKIQALATAVQAVMNANASKAQLDALGVTGVTDANLTSILAALDAATDTSELNTLANVQTVVTDAVNALSAISTAAQNNTANGTTVATAAQYDALGITGMGGTGQPTVAMINSVLNDLDIGSTQTETAAKVQAIVNAYQAILDSTDGVANNDSDNPTQTQYSTVGVNGVDTAQEESLLGDVLDTASRDGTNTDASAVDSVAKIQALATAVQAVMNANASKAQLDALGVTGVTDANLTSILAALDAATDTSELNTLANVQTVVTDAVNALSAISTAAQNNTANGTTVATAAQYDALGITGMGGTGQPTVAMINSVLNDLDIGSTQTETAAKVQAIVNAYQAILDSTDGVANNDSDNPTQTQYSTVGVNGVDTAQEESLLGDVLDTASRDGTNTDASAVDSVAKIQALATAVQAVMNANASKAQLDALGVTGVTDANLTSILAALDAATDTSELNTLANVQTVVTDAVNALSAISTAAQNNTANGTTVATAAQYDALGITGMGGTGQPTVAMINSVLNDLDIGSTQTETAAKVQAIVNAYQAILDSTDGVANNDSDNPTQTQYSTVGVNGVDTAQEESLLGDVLDTASRDGTNTDASAVDSVAKIQALATAVQAVMNANASKAQLDALGVTGVTDANLTSILAALDAATDTSELNTLANVQTVVTDAVNALSAISTAAQNNTANGTTVATAAQYDALGITGMGGTGQPTVAMINSVLNDLDIGSTQTETAAKVQAIVNAYQAILDSTDGVANNDSDNPTQTQYSTVGVNGVDTAQEESLLGDVLDTASRDGTNTDASAVDSVAKIQALATAVQAVMNANASKAQLDALGVTGVTDANLTSILAALDAATDTSELNTLANVQTVVTDAVNALSAISTAAQNNTANGTTVATAAQYDALGITGMGGTGQPTVAMINSVLNDLDIGSTQTETAAKVQAIVNAYQAILDSTDGVANNDSDNPTQTQYSTVGVNGVDTAQEESLLGDVLDTASRDGTNTDASAVDSVAKIQALATAVQAVMNANASKAQLDALGVTGVTDANLTSILAALDAATDTSELNTLANVQTVVTDAVNALSAISTAAQNNTANGTTVATAAQYDALGITGMGGTGQPTVAMINSVLNDLDIGSTQTETAAKVQAIVNAYQAILDSTDGVANNDSDNPTQTQYSTVGVNGVDTAQEESLLGDVLDTASRDGTNTDASAVDSVAKIQAWPLRCKP
jgi:hypothetical protein